MAGLMCWEEKHTTFRGFIMLLKTVLVLNPVLLALLPIHIISNCGIPPQGKAPSMVASTPKVPKSPWMPFPVLFAAIRNQVSPKDMNLIKIRYEKFRVCKIAPLNSFLP